MPKPDAELADQYERNREGDRSVRTTDTQNTKLVIDSY